MIKNLTRCLQNLNQTGISGLPAQVMCLPDLAPNVQDHRFLFRNFGFFAGYSGSSAKNNKGKTGFF
jgi:hypothetical protein